MARREEESNASAAAVLLVLYLSERSGKTAKRLLPSPALNRFGNELAVQRGCGECLDLAGGGGGRVGSWQLRPVA